MWHIQIPKPTPPTASLFFSRCFCSFLPPPGITKWVKEQFYWVLGVNETLFYSQRQWTVWWYVTGNCEIKVTIIAKELHPQQFSYSVFGKVLFGTQCAPLSYLPVVSEWYCLLLKQSNYQAKMAQELTSTNHFPSFLASLNLKEKCILQQKVKISFIGAVQGTGQSCGATTKSLLFKQVLGLDLFNFAKI